MLYLTHENCAFFQWNHPFPRGSEWGGSQWVRTLPARWYPRNLPKGWTHCSSYYKGSHAHPPSPAGLSAPKFPTPLLVHMTLHNCSLPGASVPCRASPPRCTWVLHSCSSQVHVGPAQLFLPVHVCPTQLLVGLLDPSPQSAPSTVHPLLGL